MTCVHHWVIATPSGGPYSDGKCKKCGQARSNFANALEDFSFDHDYNSVKWKDENRRSRIEAV